MIDLEVTDLDFEVAAERVYRRDPPSSGTLGLISRLRVPHTFVVTFVAFGCRLMVPDSLKATVA